MTKLFSFRSVVVVPASARRCVMSASHSFGVKLAFPIVAAFLVLPPPAATQQVQLLAGGDTEWSQYPYQPAVAYIHDDGAFRAIVKRGGN